MAHAQKPDFVFRAKRTSSFKSARGASVQSTARSRGVCISGSNAGYTMFRGSVKSTGYPLHSPVSPSVPLPCVTVCHHISSGVYNTNTKPNRARGTSQQLCASGVFVGKVKATRPVERPVQRLGDNIKMNFIEVKHRECGFDSFLSE